jgi:hypothetical protein
MGRLYLKNADLIATFDEGRREIRGGSILIDGRAILA